MSLFVNTPVLITFNGVPFQFSTPEEILQDAEFERVIEKCNYNDTGGGWRDTYRRLLTPLVQDFVKNGLPLQQNKEHPMFSILPLSIAYLDMNDLTAGQIVPHALVLDMVESNHGREEDFEEGDIINRINKFDFYVVKEMPLSDIDLTEWDVDEDYVDELTGSEKAKLPLVYDNDARSIIDGIHRANNRHENGHKTILSLVGLTEYIDPDWEEQDY